MDPAEALSRETPSPPAAGSIPIAPPTPGRMQGYEVAQGSQRECGESSGSIIEPMSNMLFSSRLSTNVSND
ncbi:hypothetical protein BRADI_1g14855v3 [Brachypodium distachyon]|uniref:Uncharacterized protein n=1 Tax=Brachypodium distachyon TaxID=15368 RepID=A0A0Q3KT32_BRADI|nr:hypothetical protein BRADI_1g14855v3 [Brachypodium distachyon]